MMDTKQILQEVDLIGEALNIICQRSNFCLLYTSDAADE